MRIPTPVYLGLVVAAGIASTIMWRELYAERQITADLRAQLAEARTALETRLAAQPAVATPQVSADVQAVSAAPDTSPAKASREAAAAVVADYAKKARTLMEDPEYRKAHLAQLRLDLQQRYAGLIVELGLSASEASALFDLLAENQLRLEEKSSSLMVDGTVPDEAALAEATRVMAAMQKQQEDALIAMLGKERYEQLNEYTQNQPSRTRVNNLTTLLARSGRPLSNAQTRSLTAAMIAEQKRMESEAKALRDSGQTSPLKPADIQAETNRRLLEGAPSYLDAQQVEVLRGRFQQRSTIDQASDRVQQRERELLQGLPN